MKFTIKQLVDDKEMLSHIFLECIPHEQLMQIKDRAGDWEENKYAVEVKLNIGGFDVNPKKFFDKFYEQYKRICKEEADKMIKEKFSGKLSNFQDKFYEMEQVVKSWEEEINWEVKNPLI